MSSRLPLIILFSIGAIAVSGFLVYEHEQKQQRIEQQRILEEKHAKEERKKIKAELQALFDVYLNDFKIEIQKKTREYKEARKALKDIITPLNFETPAYAKESFDVFKEVIKPSLQKQADDLISIFEKYRTKIREDIEQKDSDATQEFISQWKEKSDEQLSKFIDFLAKETNVIQAYDELITFYYSRSNLYTVNKDLKIFIFNRDEDIEEHARLLKVLKSLTTPQTTTTNQDAP